MLKEPDVHYNFCEILVCEMLLLSNAAVFKNSRSWAHFSATLSLSRGFQKVFSLNIFDLSGVRITGHLRFGGCWSVCSFDTEVKVI